MHGSKAIYQCLTGFELTKGDKEVRCNDGVWIGVVPTCSKINCGFPGQIQNGKILYIGTLAEYTYQPYMTTVGQNKQIRYECDKDYKLFGPSGSTCINGNWKPNIKLVQCIKDQTKSVIIEDTYSGPIRLKSKKSSPNQMRKNENIFYPDEINENRSKKLKRLKKHKNKNLSLVRNLSDTKHNIPRYSLKKDKIIKKKTNHISENKMKLKKQYLNSTNVF